MQTHEIEGLDGAILPVVRILRENGVETFESCQGGDGHFFHEPTVRFHGGQAEGLRAVSVALQHGLSVGSLRRYWTLDGGELTGPAWEMVFDSLPDPVSSE